MKKRLSPVVRLIRALARERAGLDIASFVVWQSALAPRVFIGAPGMAHWRLRVIYQTVVVRFRLRGAGLSERFCLSPLRTLEPPRPSGHPSKRGENGNRKLNGKGVRGEPGTEGRDP